MIVKIVPITQPSDFGAQMANNLCKSTNVSNRIKCKQEDWLKST